MTDALQQFARSGRSFHFASRLLPPRDRRRVAATYAYCRATDDLVDDADARLCDAELRARLGAWRELSRAAYGGRASGIAVIDDAMRAMRGADVPFAYADELIAGVGMDIGVVRYADFAALGVYAQRVAGVVGLWMTEMFDAREPWMMVRAAAMGRAMQLTNIARDVGEDWARGRLYLPQSLLRTYAIAEHDLEAMCAGARPISPAYRAAMEALLTTADAEYRRAEEAVAYLPPAFARTVAVAASVYRGIHSELRAAGYDNLTRRASTSFARKCVLGAGGLRRLLRRDGRRRVFLLAE